MIFAPDPNDARQSYKVEVASTLVRSYTGELNEYAKPRVPRAAKPKPPKAQPDAMDASLLQMM